MKSRSVWSAIAFAAALVVSGAAPQPRRNATEPVVSPDGSRIAFLSDRDGTTDLYVIDVDGGNERRLTRTPEEEARPGWSRDGKRIWFAVTNDATSRAYTINPDGTNLTLLGSFPGRVATPSPDGTRVLYSQGTWTAVKLLVSNLDGTGSKALTDGTTVVWRAQWSPDGNSIAFTSRDATGQLHISLMKADGSSRRELTRLTAREGRPQGASWSPDGKQLAMQVNASDLKAHTSSIWIVDVASGEAHEIAAHRDAYLDELPSWFPDGRRIAFQSDRSGGMEIWTMNSDGSAPGQLTGNGTMAGSGPRAPLVASSRGDGRSGRTRPLPFSR